VKKLVEAEMKILFKLVDKFVTPTQQEEDTYDETAPLTTTQYRLENYRKMHNCLYILVKASNNNITLFVPSMAGVGMAFCIACNFVCLTMYDNKDMQLFCGCAFVAIVCITWLILFLCQHTSFPFVYSEESILQWRGAKELNKLERKQCNTMVPFGFTMGPFFLAKRMHWT